jgi:hypothetical protein
MDSLPSMTSYGSRLNTNLCSYSYLLDPALRDPGFITKKIKYYSSIFKVDFIITLVPKQKVIHVNILEADLSIIFRAPTYQTYRSYDPVC